MIDRNASMQDSQPPIWSLEIPHHWADCKAHITNAKYEIWMIYLWIYRIIKQREKRSTSWKLKIQSYLLLLIPLEGEHESSTKINNECHTTFRNVRKKLDWHYSNDFFVIKIFIFPKKLCNSLEVKPHLSTTSWMI